jgi:aspartate-semialdehyde dehydrogenase
MSANKVPVAVLGATGTVGRKFVALLESHPLFELVAVTSSEKNIGQTLGPYKTVATKPNLPCSIVFSALSADVAGPIESAFANSGYTVVSNTKSHRLQEGIPLIVPEVNGELLTKKTTGQIITCPNCSVTGISLALKPLVDAFGISSLHAVTLQAISGAGSQKLDIEDNVIPFIPGEEEKIEQELKKIFPTLKKISATATRVAVTDGHMAALSVSLENEASLNEVKQAFQAFSPALYYEEDHYPQPKHHRDLEGGMAVHIGRLRPCSLLDYKFVILSHNTIRGAAGGAILTAQTLFSK